MTTLKAFAVAVPLMLISLAIAMPSDIWIPGAF